VARFLADTRKALEAEKHRLDEEIRNYPTPIPRCDAQFNHLFDRRAAIVRELEQLEAGGPEQ
jgi:hypothetical protein